MPGLCPALANGTADLPGTDDADSQRFLSQRAERWYSKQGCRSCCRQQQLVELPTGDLVADAYGGLLIYRGQK